MFAKKVLWNIKREHVLGCPRSLAAMSAQKGVATTRAAQSVTEHYLQHQTKAFRFLTAIVMTCDCSYITE